MLRALKSPRAMAVHASGSAVEVWVVPTDEGLVAAREALDLLAMT